MNFFLDENFPKTAGEVLAGRGHLVLDIRGTQDEGADDSGIFSMAQRLRAVFLTTDRDFFHSMPHLLPDHCGIVVIALRQPNRRAILSRLTWFLDHIGAQSLAGKAYLLRDHTYTVYPGQE